MKKQANAEQVIEHLTQQVAGLTKENAILNSIVQQYQEEETEEESENAKK